ncbi:TPA: hypothetical protein ACLGW6_004414 [Salmonella enterica]
MDENDIRSTGSTDTGAELGRKLDEANRRIAELESRTLTVTLPEPFLELAGGDNRAEVVTHRGSSSLRCQCFPQAGNDGNAGCGVWGGKEPRRHFRTYLQEA